MSLVHPHEGTVSRDRRALSTHDTDESETHFAKAKPDPKCCVLYDCVAVTHGNSKLQGWKPGR